MEDCANIYISNNSIYNIKGGDNNNGSFTVGSAFAIQCTSCANITITACNLYNLSSGIMLQGENPLNEATVAGVTLIGGSNATISNMNQLEYSLNLFQW